MYFVTRAGRCPARDYLSSLPTRDAAYIIADIQRVAEADGRPTVVSVRPVKGSDGVLEIKTFGYRMFFVALDGTLWVLHACKKQDQRRGIALAKQRAKELKGS